MIAIIDYGAGNLRSVQKALEFLNFDAKITSDRNEILSADHVILPGVGAFGDCMREIKKRNLTDCIKEVCSRQIPFMGICLGLQLLFEESEESPKTEGLGIFEGKIVKIPQSEGLKIPHIGWNSLHITKESRLFSGISEGSFVYFVHSYYMMPEDKGIIAAETEYGAALPIALESGNVFATQFHPEKSGETGLKILKNFGEV